MTDKAWIYVFVRMDMPIEQIVVQSCHAAQESGLAFPNPTDEPNSLIVIQVKNKEHLQKAYDKLAASGIKFVQFEETSWDFGFTAFASEPVFAHQREAFKKYRLFTGPSK
jgi:hypothetical protein